MADSKGSDVVRSVVNKVMNHELPTGCTPEELQTADPTALFVSRDYAVELLNDARTLAGAVPYTLTGRQADV